MKVRQKVVAFHEAGHAVARAAVGWPLTKTEIHGRSGRSHAPDAAWSPRAGGQYAVWDAILIALAGPFAESRVSKRAQPYILLTSGSMDWQHAKHWISLLVSHRYAECSNAAWMRAEQETREFLRNHWAKIERVAAALLAQGVLEPAELAALL